VNHYLWENKSTSEPIGLGTVYWRRLTIDAQVSMYLRAYEHLNPVGVIYNVLFKPLLRPRLATPPENRKYKKNGQLYENQRDSDESPEDFGKRCLAAILEDPNRYYQRGLIVRLENERREADLDVWQTAGMIRDGKRLKMWPRNSDACLHWSRPCDYLPICAGETEQTDSLLYRKLEDPHPELEGDKKDLLTQTALRTYRACARRYYYRYEECLFPKVEPEPLRVGKSLHRALEFYFKSKGDLAVAFQYLDPTDPYSVEKERAMLIGHAARWGKPVGFLAVEEQFRIPLMNPETGASSRTFLLGGRIDGLLDAGALGMAMREPELEKQVLEKQLEESVEAADGNNEVRE
jgi:PD-(D/E)XK nuclease superfamily protein